MTTWYEDDHFWAMNCQRFFTADRLEKGAEEVDQLLSLTGVTEGDVLDLCCGPGRHSVALAQRGLTVTGVDRTPLHLTLARERAVQAGVEVEWVQEDMRYFFRHRAFDLVVNLFTSFGYFEDEEENQAVLANVYASLKPGGTFVLDLMGKERLARVWQPSNVQEFDDGTLVVQRRKVLNDWCRVENEHLWVTDGEVTDVFRFSHTVYSGQELKSLLLETGFETVDLYGDYEGGEYGLWASRQVAVARKGES